MDQHLRQHRTLFHHRTVRGQITIENGKATGLGIGILLRADDVLIPNNCLGDAIGPRAVHCAGAGVDEPQFIQPLHHGAESAGVVQVHQTVDACRIQLHQMGHGVGNGVDAPQVEGDPRLMADGGQVQHGVGGAAQGHVCGQAVSDGLFRDDVPGADVLSHQVHHPHTGVLGQKDPLAFHGGNGAVAGEAHAQQLRHAVHGVGGEHTGAGAAAGAGVLHDVLGLLLRHLPGADGAGGLEGVRQGHLFSVGTARQHGAAGAEDSREIQPQGGHQHTGHDLVAVGDEHQAVKGVGIGHDLHGVGNVLPGGQGVEHALVVHGDAVADADGRELDGGAAGHADAGLHRLGDLVQVHVAGNDLIFGADHADDRPVQFLLGQAQGPEQGAMGNAVYAAFHQVTSHAPLLTSC